MFQFQIRDLLWMMAVACLALLIFVRQSSHNREINTLRQELEIAKANAERYRKFPNQYEDMEFFIPADQTGRIDSLTLLNAMSRPNSKSPDNK